MINNTIYQRDIVEVDFKLSNGEIKKHPVLVLSNDNAIKKENSFVCVMISGSTTYDDFSFELNDEMFNFIPKKKSQVRLHLIATVMLIDVNRKIGNIKSTYFGCIVNKIKDKVFNEL